MELLKAKVFSACHETLMPTCVDVSRDKHQLADRQPYCKHHLPEKGERIVVPRCTALTVKHLQCKNTGHDTCNGEPRCWIHATHDDVCCVCLEPMLKTYSKVLRPCGHVLHHVCFIKWKKKSKTCPLCRTAIVGPDDFLREKNKLFTHLCRLAFTAQPVAVAGPDVFRTHVFELFRDPAVMDSPHFLTVCHHLANSMNAVDFASRLGVPLFMASMTPLP